jgi:hypothetical protein
MNKHNDFPDPEKIKEILKVVSEKIPSLLKELSEVIYGVDQARQYGIAVATFFNELKSSGLSDEQAFELTQQYMETLNLGKMFQDFGHRNKEKE